MAEFHIREATSTSASISKVEPPPNTSKIPSQGTDVIFLHGLDVPVLEWYHLCLPFGNSILPEPRDILANFAMPHSAANWHPIAVRGLPVSSMTYLHTGSCTHRFCETVGNFIVAF